MIYVRPGETRHITVDGAPAGLAGQVGWRVEDLADVVVIARTTTGTVEFAAGAYRKAITFPAEAEGRLVVIADFPDGTEAIEEVEVTPAGDPAALPTTLPPGFSLEELSAYVAAARDADQAHLERLLRGAHGYAKWVTKRRLEPLPAAGEGTYTVRRRVNGGRFARVPDAREITAVTVDETAITDWEGIRGPDDELSPIHTVEVFVRGRVIEVEGRFGFDPVPVDLKDAIYTHAARNYHERTALYADLVSSPEYGTQTYLRQLPARVRDVYEAYRVASDQLGL